MKKIIASAMIFVFTFSIMGISQVSAKTNEKEKNIKSSIGLNNHKEDKDENKSEKENENENKSKNSRQFQINNISKLVSATSTIISWNTNEPTFGKVMFGTSANLLNNTVLEPTNLSLTHSVTLNGLEPNKTYLFRISAQNATSTIIQSKLKTFHTRKIKTLTTPKVVLPTVLFSTDIGLHASTTRIIWVTNKLTDSKIWVSQTIPISTTTTPTYSLNDSTYFHSFTISNLATSTQYYYTIGSTDSLGNTTFKVNNPFFTPSI